MARSVPAPATKKTSMETEKQFVNGLFFKRPNEKAPEYIIGTLSAKRNELMAFLGQQEGDWVNMVIKESKKGNLYIQIDDWKPKKQMTEEQGDNQTPTPEPVEGIGGYVPF